MTLPKDNKGNLTLHTPKSYTRDQVAPLVSTNRVIPEDMFLNRCTLTQTITSVCGPLAWQHWSALLSVVSPKSCLE